MLAINPIIKQKAEDIRKKIFGSEVRESLASGIEAISEDVEATIGRQGYVEEQFQNVIDETTDKDVISAPELIAARNGKSNLKTRLDDEHAQVTAQLQQTPNRNEVILKSEGVGLDEVKPDLLAAIEGGEGSTFNLLSIPREGSVSPSKTDFLEQSTNLLDKDRVVKNKSIDTIGNVVDHNAYGIMDYFLPGNANQTYSTYGAVRAVFYTAEKAFISTTNLTYTSHSTFTVPSNAYYVRLVVYAHNMLDTMQLNAGPTLLPYEPYYLKVKKLKLDDKVLGSVNERIDYAEGFIKGYKYHNIAGDGVSGWTGTNAAVTVNNGAILLTAQGNNAGINMRKITNTEFSSGKKIYYKAKLKAKNKDLQSFRLRALGTTGGSTIDVVNQNLPALDRDYTLNGIFTQTNQTGNVVLDVYAFYPDATTAKDKVIEVEDVIAIDLTSWFGLGNEPDVDYMNKLTSSIKGGWDVWNLPIAALDELSNVQQVMSDKFALEVSTVEIPTTIDSFDTSRLSLIATKKDNYYNADNPPIQDPQDVGYLYLDERTDKLYYSAGKFDRPEYLFDWNTDIANGSPCKDWVPIITKDGDIVFLTQGKIGRKQPIVYPTGDYANPIQIITTETTLPGGLTTDSGAVVACHADFFLWGEYQANGVSAYNGQPMRIWKVEKPYTSPANWRVVDTWFYSNTGAPWGQNPTREISHFHTVALDHYTGRYYANTGDLDAFCRVLESTDDGETWTEIASDGQEWRTLGYIFTKEACYWANDGSPHWLYKADRDVNGIIDFSTITRVVKLFENMEQAQRTYNTCLVREPYGLLLLDRAEPGTNGLFNVEFWSLEDEKLYTLAVYNSLKQDGDRYGFGNQATTYYQSTQEDGIICGSSSYDRRMGLDILNNSPENRLGVTKIKVVRKF